MDLRSLRNRARAIVQQTLMTDDPEVDRTLVAGAVVAREGDANHYKIQTGEESPDDLARAALREEGLCDCGSVLSTRGDRARCRNCGREFDL